MDRESTPKSFQELLDKHGIKKSDLEELLIFEPIWFAIKAVFYLAALAFLIRFSKWIWYW